jgi:hypothetical protein
MIIVNDFYVKAEIYNKPQIVADHYTRICGINLCRTTRKQRIGKKNPAKQRSLTVGRPLLGNGSVNDLP